MKTKVLKKSWREALAILGKIQRQGEVLMEFTGEGLWLTIYTAELEASCYVGGEVSGEVEGRLVYRTTLKMLRSTLKHGQGRSSSPWLGLEPAGKWVYDPEAKAFFARRVLRPLPLRDGIGVDDMALSFAPKAGLMASLAAGAKLASRLGARRWLGPACKVLLDGGRVVATDGHNLLVDDSPACGTMAWVDKPTPLLLPPRAISAMLRVPGGHDTFVGKIDGRRFIEHGPLTIGLYGPAEFVDYKAVLPSSEAKYEVDSGWVRKAIAVAERSDGDAPTVDVEFNKSTSSARVRKFDRDWGGGGVDEHRFRVRVNADFLRDGVDDLDCERIKVHAERPLGQITLESPTATYTIMPMRRY